MSPEERVAALQSLLHDGLDPSGVTFGRLVIESIRAAVEAEHKRYGALLAAIDAVFDVDIKYQWRILTPEAAERFVALQQLAAHIREGTQ